MKLVPLGDRVVLKQLVAEETTKSGIVLPGKEKEKPQQAEVVAVGPGGVIDGKEVKMQVSVGQKVIFSKYAGTEVKLEDDDEYIIVKQNDILAVVEYFVLDSLMFRSCFAYILLMFRDILRGSQRK